MYLWNRWHFMTPSVYQGGSWFFTLVQWWCLNTAVTVNGAHLHVGRTDGRCRDVLVLLYLLYGEWNLRIDNSNCLHRRLPDLWPRTIKLNSPLGFSDCLLLPVSSPPLASLSRSVWKIRSICFLSLMSWTGVGAIPLLTAVICTPEGIGHWSRFQT